MSKAELVSQDAHLGNTTIKKCEEAITLKVRTVVTQGRQKGVMSTT